MRKILTSLVIGTVALASPASANHIFNLDIPYGSRGECEAAIADLSNDDIFSLPGRFPELFDSTGDAASFLTRAFTCEPDGSDWYITDHRLEVLESDWFLRR